MSGCSPSRARSNADEPPSNIHDSAASGNGGTRLDQTTTANPSTRYRDAARFAMMLPVAHAIAAPMTSSMPTSVALAPAASFA